MTTRKTHRAKTKLEQRRPSEVVLEDLGIEKKPWNLQEHLTGCLVGYQADPTYSSAVYFALEAVSGIARDVYIRAGTNELDPKKLDANWTLKPLSTVEVPWIWIAALETAWTKHKSGNQPLGHSFGLEGGRGRSPKSEQMAQLLDQRAIARWIWLRVQEAQSANKKLRIEDAIQEAAEKFDRSDRTIRRAWGRFGNLERLREP